MVVSDCVKESVEGQPDVRVKKSDVGFVGKEDMEVETVCSHGG